MTIRKLATFRKITNIEPIPDADAIECATVDGWKIVVKKGEFSIGDIALYLEIDSWVPHDLAPFLSKGQEPKTYEGVLGQKLRTIKLKGQLSQGLLLPCSAVPQISNPQFGVDYTEQLNIKKWEPTIPASLAGFVKGPFPSFIQKTDQERIQNLIEELDFFSENEYEITTKLDGSSMTAYIKDGQIGVCSRNLELKTGNENKDNTLVKVLVESGLGLAMKQIGDNFAIQGELMGPGIQGNRENLKNHEFYIFDIFDIDNYCYISPIRRLELYTAIFKLTAGKIKHVPILETNVKLSDIGNNIEDFLKYANGPSIFNPIREGIVFKRTDGKFSFKVISNEFLLKEK